MLNEFRRSSIEPSLWLSLLSGAVCGAALVFFGYGIMEIAPDVLYVSADWTSMFSAAVLAYGKKLVWIVLAGFFGFSAIGAPFLWSIPFWYGLGGGFSTGVLLQSGWNGLPAVLHILCSSALTAVLLIESCSESLQQCKWLRKCMLQRNKCGGFCGFQGFLMRFAGIFLLLALCACAEVASAVACGILAE